MSIIILLLCLVLIFSFYSLYKEKTKLKQSEIAYNELKEIQDNEIRERFKEEYKERIDELDQQVEKILDLIEEKQKEKNQIESLIKEKQDFNNSLFKVREDELNRLIEEKRKEKEVALKAQLEKEKEEKIEEYNKQLENFLTEQVLLKAEYQQQVNEIKRELDEFRAKRSAINEQLRREEELANEIDFHRIILNQNDKEDISYLISIEQNIHNKELLYKLIWSEYIQKSFNQMIKNICGNKTYKNVIYCIENINNHKKYIGKTSADVSKRWTEHVKNSLNIGGIKRQPVHNAMYGHWDEFTFSILEEVLDEKLSEREKYYISFFETDKYGYNMKVG